MNVTYRPAHMIPWELQELFYEMDKYFYDYDSARVIGRLFGKEYGRRRWGLALYARLGVWGAHFCADHIKGSVYYDLKHFDESRRDMDGTVTSVIRVKTDRDTERRSDMERKLMKDELKHKDTQIA